jgi:uncharacterized protein (TIGR02231 family)
LTNQRITYLDKLEAFVAPTVTTELAKGVLNAEVLQKVTLFNFEQRKAAVDEALRLTAENRDLEKQLVLLRRKREELAAGHSKTLREAVLFLDKKAAGPAQVKLCYLSNGAGWSPAYNFRAGNDGQRVKLEYNALIQQQTGEDWSGVTLTLSTASPLLSCVVPTLAPFRVSLIRGAQQQGGQQAYQDQHTAIQRRKNVANVAQGKAIRDADNRAFNWEMNVAANDFQVLELQAEQETLRFLREQPVDSEGIAVTYALPGPVSLASRADQQLVRITSLELACKFYYVATPVLTPFVYREAELVNTAADVLLDGPVNAYLAGRFVGRGEIPSVSRGQTFVVGFGSDNQMRARRELADKSDQVQGGNRELTFKYRLILENYRDEAVTVRVLDRIPYSERANEVRVTLGELKDKLSEDALYLRTEKPKGILRWEVELPAKASADKARIVEYSYKAEFEKGLNIQNPNAPAQREEFEQMRMERQKH